MTRPGLQLRAPKSTVTMLCKCKLANIAADQRSNNNIPPPHLPSCWMKSQCLPEKRELVIGKPHDPIERQTDEDAQ